MIIILFINIILFLNLPSSFATPSINGVLGAISHEETITITGASFGAFATEQIWDDFNRSTMNTNAIIGNWQSIQGTAMDSSGDGKRHDFSTHSLRKSFGGGTCGVAGGSDQYGKWYASYWFKLDPSWVFSSGASGSAHLGNVKFFRIWHTGSGIDNWVTAIHTYSNQDTAIELVENTGDSTRWFWTPDRSISRGVWHQFEVEYSENSGNGKADGIIRLYFNGRRIHQRTNLITRTSSYSSPKRMSLIGFYNSWGSSPSYNYWLDDAYTVNSWSRVILGNAPDCGSENPSNCTHREIQPVSTWQTGSITIKLNQGAFVNGSTAYLFVIDASGTASNGYPVTIDGQATPPVISPQVPHGLRILY